MWLWVLFAVLTGYQAYDFDEDYERIISKEVCEGKDYVFPFTDLMKSRKILFTPFSSAASARLVMDEGTSVDPHFIKYRNNGQYKVKLVDMSKDYEGRYAVFLPGITNRTTNLVKLTVKDCSIKKSVQFGARVGFDLGRVGFEVVRVVWQIDYSPVTRERTEVLWTRRQAVGTAVVRDRGSVVENRYLLKDVTYADQGFYFLRDKDGKLLDVFSVTVDEVHETRTHLTGEDFTIRLPVEGLSYRLEYEPRDESGEHDGKLVTLVEDHLLLESEKYHRIELQPTEIVISDLEVKDKGTYYLEDMQGNRALVMELYVRKWTLADYGVSYTVLVGVVVAGIVVFLCCCCCRDKSPSSTPTSALATPDVYVHQPTTNYRPQPQPYSPGKPFTPAADRSPQAGPPYDVVFKPYTPHRPAASQQPPPSEQPQSPPSNSMVGGGGGLLGPSSESETPAPSGPMYSQGSAVGVDAPTVNLGFDCLSSDSGAQFELPKGLTNPSAPLSSETTSSDVYTSDKLNFNFL